MADEDEHDTPESDVTRAYKDNPSLANYLQLRTAHPAEEIEVGLIGGLDPLFAMAQELEQHGFDPGLVAAAMDADHDATSRLSLLIIHKLVEADKLLAAGETQLVRRGLAVPDKLIDWLICAMLDAMSWTGELHLHRDLIVLIRERLGSVSSYYQQVVDTHQRRQEAKWLGAQIKARGVNPSLRLVAETMGVAPSTVMRWFPGNTFQVEVDQLSKIFDSEGNLLPIRAPAPSKGS